MTKGAPFPARLRRRESRAGYFRASCAVVISSPRTTSCLQWHRGGKQARGQGRREASHRAERPLASDHGSTMPAMPLGDLTQARVAASAALARLAPGRRLARPEPARGVAGRRTRAGRPARDHDGVWQPYRAGAQRPGEQAARAARVGERLSTFFFQNKVDWGTNP
jgi:hypothetical protein